jgi:hypothetical protein
VYTIQILQEGFSGIAKREQITTALLARVEKDGRFRIGATHMGVVKGFPTLFLERVRLTNKKSYCGNHPGPCEVNPFRPQEKKKITSYLEWNDWVAFHNLVNGVLNQRHTNANVWTLPQDVSGKFWIRKGRQARVRYDYDEEMSSYGRVVRVWNVGTIDQFTP